MTEDEISLRELTLKLLEITQLLWNDRRKAVPYIIFATAAGLLVAIGSPEEYSAKMRLLPYRNGGGGAGISGIAGLAGIRIPAGGADQVITSDLYPEVASSLDFRIAVAETPLNFSSLDRKATIIDYFRNIRKPSITDYIASYTIGLPNKFASSPTATSNKIPGMNSIRQLNREYLGFVARLDGRLGVSVDKKTSILTVSATLPDPYAAADLVRVASEQLMKSVIDFESKKATDQFRFVSEQQGVAKLRLEQAQRDLATFSDRNRILNTATSQIDRDRLQREYNLAFEVYQQLSRDLEQARLKMNQDAPVFAVLERAIVPTYRTSPRRPLIIVISMLIGIIVGLIRVSAPYILARDFGAELSSR